MSINTKKRRHPTASSPHESDDDNGEQPTTSSSQISNKRRGSVAGDFAPPRLIVSERQQMAVLKQLIAGDESNTGSQSPSSHTPQPRPRKINRRNEHGETIVHIAARKGDLKQLKKVLKAGANVNEADNAGWTPLHEAVTKNQFKAARLLLKSGAFSNAPGPEGQTPLVDAVLNNNTKMAELLLNYSADPSVVDLTRLNETMSKVLKRETTVLDSSDNENDDESISPLSPLTSDNDFDHEDKQIFHSTLVEKLDKNLLQPSTVPKLAHKKPYHRFRERSPHSSDSSSHSKTRTTSGNNETSTSTIIASKNPYDFESEEEGEIRELTTEIHDEQKKKTVRKQDHVKQRTNSGNSNNQTNDNSHLKRRANKIELVKEPDYQKFESTSDEKQFQHIYRVPPLKIVLARAILQKTPDSESLNSSNMDDEDTNDNSLTIDTSSLTIPIIEENEQLFSSLSSNMPLVSSEVNEKMEINEENVESAEDNSSQISNLEPEQIHSPLVRSQSPRTISSIVLNIIISEIESESSQLNSLPIVEDDQIEGEDDDEEDDENDDEEEEIEEQENSDKSSANKILKTEKERSSTKLSLSKGDLKPTTRTLRSHARKKTNQSASNQTSSSSSNSNNSTRRVSNRRRALDNKLLLAAHEKEKKRKSISERSKKDKESTNDEIHTSSNSDDQTTELTNVEKVSNPNDDASSCSSGGMGEGSSSSSSTVTIKQPNPSTDIDFLPPNKRRLRERNAGFLSTLTTDPSTNSDHSPVETTTTTTTTTATTTATANNREIPINSIKQFLEIRQQIGKRHETMLHDFVLPKFPKDFSETTMAKKSYLIAPSFSSYSSTTPASIGIRRYAPPDDLDPHLAEVFSKQEDERYRIKIRHQVERDKLILSHEQEVLRLCGNATRSAVNQDIPFSYCSLLKDDEVYNNPSLPLPEKLINNDYTNTELGKRGKHRWNGRSFIKWLEDSNLKYKRLSCELNERQRLEAETLYSMQRMVWLKHLPKESTNFSTSGRTSYLLTERYLPKVDINSNFWTNWETSPF